MIYTLHLQRPDGILCHMKDAGNLAVISRVGGGAHFRFQDDTVTKLRRDSAQLCSSVTL